VPVKKENVYGGPNLGVYLAVNNRYFLHPPKIKSPLPDFARQIFPDIVVIETFIGGSSVLGALVAMNSFGMIIPSTVGDDELELLQTQMDKDFQITVIDAGGDNAFGNLILCNDKGAIISPLLADAKDIIAKTLNVPVTILGFAQSDLPGSCGLANNHGVVVHPMVTDQEAEIISDVLQVEIDVSTVNCGSPYLGGGAILNDVGAMFGRESTGPEIQRILEVLQID